jgi:integrase
MSEAPNEDGRAINCNSDLIVPTSDGPGSLLSEPISEQVHHLLSSSLSSNSKRAYAADFAHFKASGRHIPCPPSEVAEYIADLVDTHAVATIQRRLAAIGKAHRGLGYDDPCSAEIVRATLRGIRRTKGVAQREARALRRDDLFMVLEQIGERPIDVRDKALLLIGFAGAFRRSELIGLDCSDVEHERRGIVLHLRRSKTDQNGHGRKIAIPNGRTRWCPVGHLTAWLAHAEIGHGPVFRNINKRGHVASRRLSGEAVAKIVKRRVEAAGFDPTSFSGHSLRAGLATSAAAAGTSTWKIRQQTGHASDAMLARYIRDADMFTDNPAGAVL